MANLDYNDFRPCNCVWRMVLPTNSLKLLGFLTEEWHLATPATPLAPPGARASTSSDRSTAAPAASFNPVPLQTAKVVLMDIQVAGATPGQRNCCQRTSQSLRLWPRAIPLRKFCEKF